MSDAPTCLQPAGCQWDIYFAGLMFPDEKRALCVKGFDAMAAREKIPDRRWTFSVCRICGSVNYYNPAMNKWFVCAARDIEEIMDAAE